MPVSRNQVITACRRLVLLLLLPVFAHGDEARTDSLDTLDAHDTIAVVVADAPPYIFADGKSGFFVDILSEISRRTNLVFNYEPLPWARAQLFAAGNSTKAIMPLTRTKGREPLYQWITPILSDPYFLYQLAPGAVAAEAPPPKQSLIVTQRDSPGEEYLLRNGFSKVYAVNSPRIGARMLLSGRAHYWFVREMLAIRLVTEEGGDPKDLKAIFGYDTEPMYLSAGLDLDERTVAAIRQAMEAIHQDGTYDQILQRYLNP